MMVMKIVWTKVSLAVTHPWLPDSKFLMGYVPFSILISVQEKEMERAMISVLGGVSWHLVFSV